MFTKQSDRHSRFYDSPRKGYRFRLGTLRSEISNAPRGTVLLLVLVVVMLLSLGAYIFAETMVSERAATEMYARKVVTRTAADSGIEYVAAILDQRSNRFTLDINHNPMLFQGIEMQSSERVAGRARFSIVAPVESDPAFASIRFGLVDESGKLNLNTLLPKQRKKRRFDEVDDSDPIIKSESERAEVELPRQRLLRLPGMTHELADAILDWLDEDDLPRQYGAENEYYANLNRQTRNGPIQSLDELLFVRGVSRELIYGEDANLNGLLDPNENDGAQTPPLDNADGILDRGWSAVLTVDSRETNLRADGAARINVNGGALDDLKQKLTAAFGEEVAEFVIAFRTYGPATGKPVGGEQNSTPGENQAAASVEGTATDTAREIRSLYELIGSEVTVPGKQTLQSPWSSEASSIQRQLPAILEKLTISDEPFIKGRININQARREVLLGVPGLDQQLVDAIINSQAMLSRSAPSSNGYYARSTTAWLLVEGLVDLETMRNLDRYLTARGDVFRLQVVGYYQERGPTTRLEAVVDATRRPSKLISIRDLSAWGAGYSHEQLNLPAASR
jgi:type II secretory pathway component PulK